MKLKFFILPAAFLALTFGCDSDRRTAQSDGYQETDGINQEYQENVEEANTDESLGGEGSFAAQYSITSHLPAGGH